uniref:Alternative protein RELN n=1 Tax=Homo sapiens TaxID=9606 RepID=L8E7R1_HUMAN|nr:alternative protein RELN [Homo sapiens]
MTSGQSMTSSFCPRSRSRSSQLSIQLYLRTFMRSQLLITL